MKKATTIGKGMALLALVYTIAGCVVAEPREGYYDRDHHRYYHERGWHECAEHDRWCN
jgi:hypothetical protein